MPVDQKEQIKKLRSRNALHDRYSQDWDWADALRNGLLSDVKMRAKFLDDRGGTEEVADFTQRCKLTDYSPDTPRIVSRVTQVVWADEPRRDFAEGSELTDFVASAGPCGESIDELAREAAQEATWKRYALLLMDRPALSEAEAAKVKTKADEKAAGLSLPYFTIYPAERILDWRTDNRGKLIYVKVTSGLRRTDEKTEVEEIREVELIGIRLWKIIKESGQGERLEDANGLLVGYSEGVAAAKVLPVVIARWEKILGDPIDSRTPLIECLLAERGAMRLLSLFRWDCYIAGHPHLKLWKWPTPAQAGAAAQSAGPTTYHLLTPEADGRGKEDMGWLEIVGTGLDQIWTAYLDAKREILTKAGIDGRAVQSGGDPKGMANSAAQVQVEFEVSEGCTLKGMAALAEQIENDMIDLVKLDRSIEEDKAVEYKKAGFMGQSPAKALTQAMAWERGPSDTYKREAWKQAGKESFPNLDKETHDKAHKEIEGAKFADPQAPDVLSRLPEKKKPFERAVPAGAGGAKPAGETRS